MGKEFPIIQGSPNTTRQRFDKVFLFMKWLFIALIAFFLYDNQLIKILTEKISDSSRSTTQELSKPKTVSLVSDSRYKCDGRTHCSSMTSCEEANFFYKIVLTLKWMATMMVSHARNNGATENS